MAGRPKNEWKETLKTLKAKLPKGADARTFKRCWKKQYKKYDEEQVTIICNDHKWNDKVDDVLAFLTHLAAKKNAKSTTVLSGVVRKPKGTDKVPVAREPTNLLSKKTYKGLSTVEIEEVFKLLVSMHKERKEEEIAEIDAQMAALAEKKELCQKSNVSIGGV